MYLISKLPYMFLTILFFFSRVQERKQGIEETRYSWTSFYCSLEHLKIIHVCTEHCTSYRAALSQAWFVFLHLGHRHLLVRLAAEYIAMFFYLVYTESISCQKSLCCRLELHRATLTSPLHTVSSGLQPQC